jgi:hypothetical protein
VHDVIHAAIGDKDERIPPDREMVALLTPKIRKQVRTCSCERSHAHETFQMVLGAARGMAYLHGCKLVHLDLKPLNLMVSCCAHACGVCAC